MMQIGVVTVLYNTPQVIPDFIKSIACQSYHHFILYAVDNSSNDDCKNVLHEELNKFPYIKFDYIKTNANEGVAKGNNIGIQKALNDACTDILISNNDIVFNDEKMFEKLVNITTHKNEKIIAPKIYYHQSKLLWYAGGYYNKILALGVHIGNKKVDKRQYNTDAYCEYAPCCFVLINKTVFEKTGLMFEKYFAYYDDTDFMYRAIKQGFKLYYTSISNLEHKVSFVTGGDDSLFYIYYSNRNKFIFIKRNFNFFNQLLSIAVFFITRTLRFLKYNKAQKKALLKGIKDGLKYFLFKT